MQKTEFSYINSNLRVILRKKDPVSQVGNQKNNNQEK